MKAKLIVLGLFAEVVLQNAENKTYKVEFEKDGEYDIEDFKTDIAAKVQEDFMEDVEFELVDEAAIKKLTPAALKKRGTAAKGLEDKLIKSIVKKMPAGAKAKAKPTAKPKAKPAAKEKPAKEKAEVKPKKVLTKAQKERAEALEAAKATKEYKAAKRNIGKTASYTAKREGKKVTGEVKGLSFSKDLKRIYYTINTGKKTTCCAVGNESLELSDSK